MTDSEIALRVRFFNEQYRLIATDGRQASVFRERFAATIRGLSEAFSEHQPDELLSDMTAAHLVSGDDESARLEREERLNGAAFYLASCHADMIGRISERWRGEAEIVRYLTRNITTAPSLVTGEDRRNQTYPEWSRVRKVLAELFPCEDARLHDQAIILEQIARNKAAEYLPPYLVTDSVSEFWEAQWERLTSGFPYFAFRSRFVYWWKQCVSNHRWWEHGKKQYEAVDCVLWSETRPSQPDGEPEPPEMSVEQLRWFREGYRLVRTTFFRRPDIAESDKTESDADMPADYAYENERLRRALDELWYRRLEIEMGEDLPQAAVRQIVARFPFLGEKTLNTYGHRIRLRISAYTLARLRRFTNAQIRSARRASKRKGAGGCAPLSDEPGVLTVASLARMVPPDHTLLLAFTAHVFLHPIVEPQRPDPWHFKRYAHELWWWIREETFSQAVEHGAHSGSRAHRAAQESLRESAFGQVIEETASMKAERELEYYLSERELASEQREALALVGKLLGDDETCEEVCAAFEKSVRGWLRRSPQHWIVPVWYLKHIEQSSRGDVVSRLALDRVEVEPVANLFNAM
jgi:hypothetical protein